MALSKSIVWRKITLPNAYFKVFSAADSHSVSIGVLVFSCEESRRAGDQELYPITFNVPFEIHQVMFSESALKQENVTALSQTYEYLKRLPEFSDCVFC